ncbi:hypothetical protein SAMN05444748_101217 [Variovorax sp. OV700]|nr:hypothetical protein SAMN05444748_101217 [Variovorax sp. OV700]
MCHARSDPPEGPGTIARMPLSKHSLPACLALTLGWYRRIPPYFLFQMQVDGHS